jgi:hypothetical protein
MRSQPEMISIRKQEQQAGMFAAFLFVWNCNSPDLHNYNRTQIFMITMIYKREVYRPAN